MVSTPGDTRQPQNRTTCVCVRACGVYDIGYTAGAESFSRSTHTCNALFFTCARRKAVPSWVHLFLHTSYMHKYMCPQATYFFHVHITEKRYYIKQCRLLVCRGSTIIQPPAPYAYLICTVRGVLEYSSQAGLYAYMPRGGCDPLTMFSPVYLTKTLLSLLFF